MAQAPSRQEMKERQRWATCDPVTLVAAARHTIYSDSNIAEAAPEVRAQLEEVISRFEQQTRAALGSAGFVGAPPNTASQ